jgi:hypothetical protein
MLELNDTRTIPALVQGGETPTSTNATLALDQGGAKPVVSPKGLISHGGTTFMTLAKNRTVLEPAGMFKVSGEVYLSYLREFDGWASGVFWPGRPRATCRVVCVCLIFGFQFQFHFLNPFCGPSASASTRY